MREYTLRYYGYDSCIVLVALDYPPRELLTLLHRVLVVIFVGDPQISPRLVDVTSTADVLL